MYSMLRCRDGVNAGSELTFSELNPDRVSEMASRCVGNGFFSSRVYDHGITLIKNFQWAVVMKGLRLQVQELLQQQWLLKVHMPC